MGIILIVIRGVAQLGRALPWGEEVVGSNPAAPTISDRQPLRVTPVKAYFLLWVRGSHL